MYCWLNNCSHSRAKSEAIAAERAPNEPADNLLSQKNDGAAGDCEGGRQVLCVCVCLSVFNMANNRVDRKAAQLPPLQAEHNQTLSFPFFLLTPFSIHGNGVSYALPACLPLPPPLLLTPLLGQAAQKMLSPKQKR